MRKSPSGGSGSCSRLRGRRVRRSASWTRCSPSSVRSSATATPAPQLGFSPKTTRSSYRDQGGGPVSDLPALAVEITKHLRQHFPAEQERDRQVFALAEEAGEVQEAYLLWLHGGPSSDVEAELADV